ncbi:TetR/AcrR family transcriptional regulator [Blastococcus saxobsidens]|uniref:TetR family transcriptional regulator n=1 Tax=Blastococcus saxobsidens TaxID=138336 RepID=A0A4Q7Y4F6_9ACTN|nr:TetR/AcrR family transcriptional regulator [Blastococcus saxobsidens]RZU31742.1 TetR family transcriptional regulator [Blastococcus saxobsidens]
MTQTTRTYRMQARAQVVQRTRERILVAARDRFLEFPYDDIRLADVAADAEVTQQTLLNHFTSKEGLALAVVQFMGPEIDALRGTVAPGDVAGFVRGLMRQYEALGDANVRLAAVAERIPALGAGLQLGRSRHIEYLEEAFGVQLPEDARARRRALAALYAVTDVGAWKLLRRDLGHSRADTTRVLQSLLRATLATTHTP